MAWWRYGWLLIAVLGIATGCTSHTPEPADDIIDLEIRARVLACAPEPVDNFSSTWDCGDLPLPLVNVTVTSGDQIIWTGQTGNEGNVEAQFPNTGPFTITVIGQPWILEEMQSQPITPNPDGAPMTEYIYSNEYYTLESLGRTPAG